MRYSLVIGSSILLLNGFVATRHVWVELPFFTPKIFRPPWGAPPPFGWGGTLAASIRSDPGWGDPSICGIIPLVADNVFILLSPRTMGKIGALHGLNDACELKCGVAYGRWTRAEITRRQEEKIWVRCGWAYVF